MIKDYKKSTIWIIGASSGIGRALAKQLSEQGAKLFLSARRKDELKTLNQELGGAHHILTLDVSNEHSILKAADHITDLGKLDSVIYMAASYVPDKFQDASIDTLKNAIDINFNGAISAVLATHKIFKKQGHGQIALCASVAGYRGLPKAQPYSATKAALINLCESLHIDFAKDGIDVKVINPGFVRTPLTDKNEFKMPMIIEADDAAKAIAKGLKSSSFEIHFPKKFTFIMKLVRILPNMVYFWLVKKIR